MMPPENRESFYNDLIRAVKKASQESPEAELSEFSAILFAVVFQCYEQVFHEDAKSRYLSALAIQMVMVAMTDEQAHTALEAAIMVSKDLIAKGMFKPDHPSVESP